MRLKALQEEMYAHKLRYKREKELNWKLQMLQDEVEVEEQDEEGVEQTAPRLTSLLILYIIINIKILR